MECVEEGTSQGLSDSWMDFWCVYTELDWQWSQREALGGVLTLGSTVVLSTGLKLLDP